MSRDDILSFLRDFKNRYGDRCGIISLGVFGSVARGEVRDDGDVDICIRTRTPDYFTNSPEGMERIRE
ncbi:MAG: nucleotidyltransferase domain-containing protein [Proteobacteria bacterium]|nr:nucleotidyltransferase domain-containing protein [Pseudomonadota bacterium]